MTLHVTIAGVEYGEVPRDSLEVTETLGSPPSARFRLDDMESALASDWYGDKQLADVRIWDTVDAGDLFRGQLVNVRASIEGVRRVFEFEAEGYDRLLDYTLVGHELSTYQYATMTMVPYQDQDAYHIPYEVSISDPYYADPNANTGIALPARDDKSVVQAFFDHYWRGPALTYDIVQHANVDSGEIENIANPGAVQGRLYFGQTALRDVLDQIASLVSGRLAFWIDADLVFHWRTLPTVGVSSPSPPSGSGLNVLGRGLPQARDVTFSPYVISQTAAEAGRVSFELPMSGVVDGVYVRTAQIASSGMVDFGTSHGAQAYISAPWVTDAAGASTAANYAVNEYGTQGRMTIGFETTADWHDVHVGDSLTFYDPGLGITSAPIVRQVTTRFLPENIRVISLQLGDAVIRTMSRYAKASRSRAVPDRMDPEAVPWPKVPGVGMGYKIDMLVEDVQPKAGQRQVVYAQYCDSSMAPLAVGGLRLEWAISIMDGEVETEYVGNAATSDTLPFYLSGGYTVTGVDGRSANVVTAANSVTADQSCVVTATYSMA